jgi:hypothetical protein
MLGVEFCRRCERRRVSIAEVGFDSIVNVKSSSDCLIVLWIMLDMESATHAAQAAFAGLDQFLLECSQ